MLTYHCSCLCWHTNNSISKIVHSELKFRKKKNIIFFELQFLANCAGIRDVIHMTGRWEKHVNIFNDMCTDQKTYIDFVKVFMVSSNAWKPIKNFQMKNADNTFSEHVEVLRPHLVRSHNLIPFSFDSIHLVSDWRKHCPMEVLFLNPSEARVCARVRIQL